MRTEDLFFFIRERYAIWERKSTKGYPKPWTKDKILQQYRFCNVYRELDTQTIWFAKNWREPNTWEPNIWFASLVFRLVNWHETAEDMGYPHTWRPHWFVDTLHDRRARKLRVFNPAYMISTHGVAQDKAEFFAERLSEVWERRQELGFKKGDTLNRFHERLTAVKDIGSFTAAQVVADIKYAAIVGYVDDWWTFAASGPGSRRGLNRVVGLPVSHKWRENEWRKELRALKAEIDPMLKRGQMPLMHAQDLQNCLCEFDKYERIRLGEGRPKQRYNGEGK